MNTIATSRCIPILLLLAILGGCETQSDPVSVVPPDNSSDATPENHDDKTGTVILGADNKGVVKFDSGDPAMDKAMRQGTQTLERFFAAHSSPAPKQERFNLKITLRSGTRVEYIWLDELRVGNDAEVSGVLLNQPFYSKAHQQGDRISVSRDDIVDWSYVDDGCLIGGYTLRVMFDQYPEDQRETLQQQLGYRIDPNKGT